MDSFKALLFGMTMAIAIGPIALLIMNTAITQGYRAGFSCALGATTADFTFALLAFISAGVLVPLLQAHQQTLYLIAAVSLMLFALWMAYGALRCPEAKAAEAKRPQRHFLTTFVLTLLNPLTVLALTGFAVQLTRSLDVLNAAMLALSVAAGTGVIALVMAAGAGWLGKVLVASSWFKTLNLVSSLGIFLFGAWGAAQVMMR